MDKRTFEKIVVVKKGDFEKLKEFIDEDVLSVEYGGKNKDEIGGV